MPLEIRVDLWVLYYYCPLHHFIQAGEIGKRPVKRTILRTTFPKVFTKKCIQIAGKF